MIKLVGILTVLSLVILSCGDHYNQPEVRIAKGGKVYGGNFRIMSPEKITSLMPTSLTDVYAYRLVSQLFEPLMQIDPQSLEIVPAVAESFTVNDAGDEYTFKIRRGIVFHEDECFDGKKHELNAEDVKFSLELACSGLEVNGVGFHLINRIEGAKDFRERSKNTLPKNGVNGITVVDPYTVRIKLVQAMNEFERVLAQPSLGIFPKEAYEKYGKDMDKHPVGTGPFMLANFGEDKVIFKRNDNYWGKDELGNQLPFMDSVTITFTEDKRDELMAFRSEKIDLVFEIPVEEIDHILGSLKEAQEGKNLIHKVLAAPSLSTSYVAYNNQSEIFKDAKVRKAFNLAINRKSIVENDLEGEGIPVTNGFVPSFNGYDASKVKGIEFNPELAKKTLKEAGFPNGNGLRTLSFYVSNTEGSVMHKMSEGVAKQLKEVLNVNVKIVLCTLKERIAAIESGKADLWSAGWLADYMDAENFLATFYSKNIVSNGSVNLFRFVNEAFDANYEKAMVEMDDRKRETLLIECDQILTDECAVIPVYTEMQTLLLNGRIRNFHSTPIETLDLKAVYIKEIRKK